MLQIESVSNLRIQGKGGVESNRKESNLNQGNVVEDEKSIATGKSPSANRISFS